jgi:adenosylcobinamide kinase / adenosylcobinamide-phosphate guanylyltransferase
MAVTLLIGGARSGKSSLAVARALDWQRAGCSATNDRSVVFVATGASGDAEMADRIARHQAERPGSWSTVEAPIDLVTGLRSGAEACAGKACAGELGEAGEVGNAGQAGANETALVVDCLSMWVANHLMAPFDALADEVPLDPLSEPELIDWDAAEQELLRQVDECFVFLATRSAPTWFVSNEVGLSLVPMTPLGRRYRDVLGRVNARVSLLADEAFLTVAGRVLRLERP